MLGLEQWGVGVRVATVLVPAAAYFFLLGLLNSQRRPQMLAGRTDFVLLVVTFSPIFCVPVLNYFGVTVWAALAVVGSMTAAAFLLAPPGKGNWVIYNLALPEALRAAERALREMDEPFERHGRRLSLGRYDVTLRFSSMPLLRNVSISAQGRDMPAFEAKFRARLGEQMGTFRTRPSPMAVTFLLISTAMLVAPLGMVAHRMPEMVRLLTDLIK